MNELNYASLEVSKKLHDAGIVLDTDVVWAGIYGTTVSFENQKWVLIPKSTHNVQIPAPCFIEVWRELPQLIHKYQLTIKGEVSNTLVGYSSREDWLYYVRDSNPTDALIDLLIFVRKEKS